MMQSYSKMETIQNNPGTFFILLTEIPALVLTGSSPACTTTGRKDTADTLFAMADAHLDAKLFMQMSGQMLGTVDAAVLAAGTAEREHQVGESALKIALYVGIGKTVDALEKGKYLAVVLEKADDRLVKAGQLLVRLVATGIVRTATVEDVSATVATIIGRNAFTIGEAEDANNQRATAIVARGADRAVRQTAICGCGAIIRRLGAISRILEAVIGILAIISRNFTTVSSRLEAISRLPRTNAASRPTVQAEAGHTRKTVEHVYHIRIREGRAPVHQRSQIVDGRGDALNEVALALEVSAEPVGAKHLQGAEQYEEVEPLREMAHGGDVGIL